MKSAMAVRCARYAPEDVERALDDIDAQLDLFSCIQPGMRVLVKPNLLKKCDAQQAITTHPAVVRAVVERAMARGGAVVIGDSPGSPIAWRSLQSLYKACGMQAVAEQTGAQLNFDQGGREVALPGARQLKVGTIANMVLDADAVIDVAKLKTHALMRYTGAVKNLYGCIPGTIKTEYHLRIPDRQRFAQMLVDLAEFVRPCISIIDGIYAMEGEGPGSGTPRFAGCLIASANPHQADVAGVRMMGWQPASVPTLVAAAERGLCDLFAQPLGDARAADPPFAPPSTGGNGSLVEQRLPKGMARAVERHFAPRPRIKRARCIGCAECAGVCPAKAIRLTQGKAGIDASKCIRCYCCHEMCPAHAIEIWRSRLFRLLQR